MSGWTRREVAIAVAAPPPIMQADAMIAGRKGKDGAARHWALYYDEVRMLVLRSSLSVRTSEPEPAKAAIERAVHWWAKHLMFVTLDPTVPQQAYAWETEP
jgi:hypothetical protein